MIPKVGSLCDVCALGAHYGLECEACGHAWEEPSFPCEFTCPNCGVVHVVKASEHDAFEQLLSESGARPLASARRPSGVWGWATIAQAGRTRAG